VLIGESGSGTWQLTVNDQASGDTGTLTGWGATLCPAEAATPEMRLRELRSETDGVHLTWWPYPGLNSYRVYRSAEASSAAAFVDVTSTDDDDTDTIFLDGSVESLVFYLVTGVGPRGEGPKGHLAE